MSCHCQRWLCHCTRCRGAAREPNDTVDTRWCKGIQYESHIVVSKFKSDQKTPHVVSSLILERNDCVRSHIHGKCKCKNKYKKKFISWHCMKYLIFLYILKCATSILIPTNVFKRFHVKLASLIFLVEDILSQMPRSKYCHRLSTK